MSVKLKNLIQKRFISSFNSSPVLFFSPGRINLIGEHTDYNNGFVLPAAIDKGIVLAVQKNDSLYCTVVAHDLDATYQFDLNSISPIQNGGWKNYIIGVVAEIQNYGKSLSGFNIVFGGNIPKGAGMSSSAALENSIVFGLNEIFELGLTKKEMIQISQRAEHNFAKVNCGIMDQFASMFGIKDYALLLDCKTMESKSTAIDFGNYQLLLINTNVKHSLTDSAYNDRREKCESIAKLLKKESLREVTKESLDSIKDRISGNTYQKGLYVIEENDRVLKTVKALESNNLEEVGNLLYQSHEGLQHQFNVSCEELDFLVDYTRNTNDVLGARMMGGGFGGCTINLIKTTAVVAFSEQVKNAYKKKFNLECSIYNIALSNGTHKLSIT
ncbi:MAG: galactokinase [Bacteroidetes bacterium MedPE-SWsnd-G1]|nr:MAG: galactokinase [Bacteroidetes bacterium MedPE-SWsnd-G1]